MSSQSCKQCFCFLLRTVLPSVPKDVIIEHTTSSSVRVGWSVPTLSSTEKPLVYNVELTTSYGSVISRRSTKQRSLVFSNLQSNTHYRIRVQAENSAGNGSSSHFTSLKTKDSKYNGSNNDDDDNDNDDDNDDDDNDDDDGSGDDDVGGGNDDDSDGDRDDDDDDDDNDDDC